MAEKGVTRMPVVGRGTRKFLGLIVLDDLLKARGRHLEKASRRASKTAVFFAGHRFL
jgi:CBS domain-containing protein